MYAEAETAVGLEEGVGLSTGRRSLSLRLRYPIYIYIFFFFASFSLYHIDKVCSQCNLGFVLSPEDKKNQVKL